MRTISGAERSVVQTATGFWAWAYLEVTNFDGTWINLGALAAGSQTLNLFNTLTWSDNIDANTLSMQATMKREIGAYSLVPFRSDSPINVDDSSTYQPLLDLHRQWRLWGVLTARGVYPDPEDYREWASGWVDRIDIPGEPATIAVQGRGMEADLIDRRIMFVDPTADPLVPITSDTPKTYAGGTQADVIQAILDEELGTGVITLTVDGSAPSEYVNGWDQGTDIGLFDLLTQIASLGGGSLRYRYDASDVLSLTLYSVNRNPSVADWQTDGNEYEKLDVGIGNSAIRNFVAVRYVDASFGIQAVTSPVVPPWPPTSASIARYEVRPLSIDLSADTRVNEQTAAGGLADAIRADMEFPLIEQRLVGTGLWFGGLGDYVKVVANGVHYNEDQYGGITDLSQTLDNGELVSTFGLSGKPKGRYLTWLDFGPGAPRPTLLPELTASGVFVDGTNYTSDVPQVQITTTMGARCNSATIEWFTDSALTVPWRFFTIGIDRAVDGNPFTMPFGLADDTERNQTYYARVTPYSGPLVPGPGPSGVAGNPVIVPVYAGTQMTPQSSFDEIIDELNDTIGDLAGTVGAIGIPTVFLQVVEDDQWLALSTIPTAETEIGSEYRQQRHLAGAGSVRLHANVKAITGTPTIRLKFTANAFGATTLLLSFTPGGTGLRSTPWAALPDAAKADVGLGVYVGDGADTAALDLFALVAEFLPTIVTGGRVHTAAFAAAFN